MFYDKDIILDNINMKDVLNKYNFKIYKNLFCCPFHNDKHPSAKIYNKKYYCFACGNRGDLIDFVANYFNLSFKDAIKKINYDFCLNLNTGRISEQRFKELEQKKQQRQKEKEEYNEKMLYLCKAIITCNKINNKLKSQLTPYNWEEIEEARATLTNYLEMLEMEFEELNVKTY